MIRLRTTLLLLAASLPAALPGQGATEIIRGTVLDDRRQPLPQVDAVITGITTQTVLRAQTNSKGVFTAVFPGADGEYLISVRRIGYRPVTMRLTRTGISSILATEIILQSVALRLDSITVIASQTPSKSGDRASIGGLEQNLLGGAGFLLDPTDLFALIGGAPGLLLAPGDSGKFSAMGAGTNQNSTVVDGMKFAGGSLPQDAIASAKVITSSFDPARGQFSGAQIAIKTKAGTDVWQGVLRANTVNRRTTWTDPTSPRPAPEVQGFSGSVSGPFRKGKTRYILSGDVSFRTEDNFSLLAVNDALLAPYGLSRDTLSAVTAALGTLGIPRSLTSIPDHKGQDKQTVLGRFDWTPSSTVSLTLTGTGNWTQTDANGISQLTFPALATFSRNRRVGGSMAFSGYVGGMLDELNVAVSHGSSESAPYLAMAGGTVRVGVALDGREGLNNLRFGGGTSGASRSRQTTLEVTNELSWLTGDSKHRFKIGQSFDGDWDRNTRSSNRQGQYTYLSLADLAANRPARYTRTLSTSIRDQRGLSTGFWAGDEWLPSKALQFQGGLRMDILYITRHPEYNPVVDSVFGLRTDRIGNQMGLSPRLGFSWASAKRRGGSQGPSFNGTSSSSEALAFNRSGAQKGIAVSGGVGAFRGLPDPEDIADLMDATGLPSTTRFLSCTGEATPIPAWSTPGGSILDHCADGSGGTTFAVTQPSVNVMDPSYRRPTRWTGNLGIDGINFGGLSLGVTGSYSLNVNRESSIDVNFRTMPGFVLANESGRPVFAEAERITASSGVVAPGASRINQDFGRVTRMVSDLETRATQINVSLALQKPLWGRLPLNVQYAFQSQRATERGFNATTAGNPLEKSWARGRQPTHQFTITTTPRLWWFALGIRATVQSGTPYTPVIVGDVNGDGSASNDRAFVFDPATLADGDLAAQMNQLLASTPANARRCLLSQMGRIAGRNSCMTGWQVRTDLSLNFSPPSTFGLGNRLRLTTAMQNTTGALVRVFGLDNTALGRSASSTTPDARLLHVTGFDPATRQFRYRVNQLFGESEDFGASRRRFAPFQVQVGLEYKFGGPPTSPIARSMGLLPVGKAREPTLAEIRSRLAILGTDPVEPIVTRAVDLGLTPAQSAGLTMVSARFAARRDSLLAPLVAFVVAEGRKLRDQDLTARMTKLQPALRALGVETIAEAGEVLTAEQRRLLPAIFPVAAPVVKKH